MLATLWLSGCAFLHHVQIGDIDNTKKFRQVPFDIKVSEAGVSLDDLDTVARLMDSHAGQEAVQVLSYFQQGPKTGNPVYRENYARNIIEKIHQSCPSGRISGLTSIRETRKYPVISGEIVKVTGYCLQKR